MKDNKKESTWFAAFWSLMHVNVQILRGLWRLLNVPIPRVTIFGSARMHQKDPYAQQAHELANRLVEHDISVLTGGGPGIMEAASCGAVAVGKKGRVIGIGVKELGEGRNPCVQEYFELDYFFARKWLMTHYSNGFIVFPGGFGTLDELGEVLTLIQTKKLRQVPIVLIGAEYWELFMRWLQEEALIHGTIDQESMDLFSVTDDVNEAFNIIYKHCEKIESAKEGEE